MFYNRFCKEGEKNSSVSFSDRSHTHTHTFTNGPGDLSPIPGRVIPKTFKKWYLILPCLTLSNIRYVSRVKWSNQGKGVAPPPTPRCSSYWKGSLRVALNYGRQLCLRIYWKKSLLLNKKRFPFAFFPNSPPHHHRWLVVGLAPAHVHFVCLLCKLDLSIQFWDKINWITNLISHSNKKKYAKKIDRYVYIYEHTTLGGIRGVMVKAIACGIVVSEFVLQSRYYVHFRANTLGKGMNPLILPAMG